MEMSLRLLLLGEDNPLSLDPGFALYCDPPGCAGYRLRRILGLPEDDYLAIARMNLCDGSWSNTDARERAKELLAADKPWRVLVLLGRKVTSIFEKIALGDALLVPFATATYQGRTLISLPHPSGRNASAWTPQARARARQLVRDHAPDLAWDQSAQEMTA